MGYVSGFAVEEKLTKKLILVIFLNQSCTFDGSFLALFSLNVFIFRLSLIMNLTCWAKAFAGSTLIFGKSSYSMGSGVSDLNLLEIKTAINEHNTKVETVSRT